MIADIEANEKLKLMSPTFSQFFLFSPNDNPPKTMKDVFYFIEIALFILEIFKLFYFDLPLLFSLSVISLELDPRKMSKFIILSTV